MIREKEGKEAISWIVLDEVAENSYLIVTEKALINLAYNKEAVDTSWETCSLRQWLNNEFIETAFTTEEAENIQLTNLVAGTNPIVEMIRRIRCSFYVLMISNNIFRTQICRLHTQRKWL